MESFVCSRASSSASLTETLPGFGQGVVRMHVQVDDNTGGQTVASRSPADSNRAPNKHNAVVTRARPNEVRALRRLGSWHGDMLTAALGSDDRLRRTLIQETGVGVREHLGDEPLPLANALDLEPNRFDRLGQ